MLQKGRVGHDGEIGAVEFEAHVDLFGNPGQQLRQGLVDGIQGDGAADAGMDVNINLGVAGQGEEQVAHGNVVDDDTVGFSLAAGARLGQGEGLLDWGWNVCGGYGRGRACRIQMALEWFARGGRCAGGQQKGNKSCTDWADFHRVLPCLSGIVMGYAVYRYDAST